MGCLVGTGFLLYWEGGEEVHLIISNNLIQLKYSHQRSFVSVFLRLNFSLINLVRSRFNLRLGQSRSLNGTGPLWCTYGQISVILMI